MSRIAFCPAVIACPCACSEQLNQPNIIEKGKNPQMPSPAQPRARKEGKFGTFAPPSPPKGSMVGKSRAFVNYC